MKQKLLNKFWLRVGMIVAVMTTALAGTVKAADETITFSTLNLSNGVQYETINGTDCILTFGDGDNDGKYYDTGAAIRVYADGHMTVSSSTKTITKIELTFGTGDKTNTITTDVDTYSNGTWEGSASSVTFTVGGSSGHRRIASVAVTYAGGTPTPTTYTVTYNANGGSGTMTDPDSPYASGATVTVLDNEFTRTDYDFTGWNTAADGSGTGYDEGDTFTINANTTLYAQWEEQASGDAQWVLTSLADLTASDVFVIVGNGYAMTNNNGTGSAPATSAVTITGSTITSTVAANIQWTVSGDATNGYTFYPNGSTTTWLYCNTTASSSSNNNMRVGTGDRKVFELNSNNYLVTKDDYTTRYLSIYNNADWRGYTSTSNGVVALSFYKKVTGGVIPPSISANNVNIEYDATSGTFTFTVNNPVDGGTTSVAQNADWISNAAISGNIVSFTTTENEAGAPREGIITLTYSYGDNQTVTENVTVTQAGNPNGPGSENNPYTVAQARVAIDANTGTQGVYATGIVSEIPTAWSSQYNNITFNFVDAEGDTDFLQAYRCVSTDAADASTVAVGDIVVVKGNLTKYGSTYEFAQGCELVSLTHPTITEPSIVVTTTMVTAPADGLDGTITVTYNNITEIMAEVVFCDAEGGAATYDWLEAEIDNDNNVYYVIEANEGGARTAYIKVYALDDDANDVYSELITINQAAYVAPSTEGTIVFGNNGTNITSASVTGDDSMGNTWTITSEGTTSYTQNTAYSQVGKAAEPATSITFTTTLPAEATITSFEAKFGGFKDTAGDVTLKVGENTVGTGSLNGTADVIVPNTSTATGTTLTVTVTNIAKGVKCYYISYEVEVEESIKVKLNASGYATFASTQVLDFTDTEGYTAWAVTAVNGSTITFSQITGPVPAGTGVLLKGTASTEYTLATGTEGAAPTGNLLEGVVAPKAIEAGQYYGLSGAKFVKVNTGIVPAGKALLPASALTTGVKTLTFNFDEDATAIKAIDNEQLTTDGVIYNVAGQRLSKMQKGINIVNGRKVLY